jgi:hypothetical protein
MQHLHATGGLLIAGAGLTREASDLAGRLGIRVIDGDELRHLVPTHLSEHSVRVGAPASSAVSSGRASV